LIVPFTGTRPLRPNTSTTSNGGRIPAASIPAWLTSLVLNLCAVMSVQGSGLPYLPSMPFHRLREDKALNSNFAKGAKQ